VILLYQDVVGDKFINGIFFDIKTNLAKWHYALNDFYPTDDGLRAESAWVPLEQILSSWLEQWEIGKYGFKKIEGEEGRYDLHLFPWTSHGLSKSLEAWNSLLTTVESRLPKQSSNPIRHPPIEISLLESENYNSFASAFLSQAPLPTFKFLAPGITFFTPSLFKALYATSSSDTERKYNNMLGGNHSQLPYDFTPFEDDSRVSLIFPSLTTIPSLEHLKQGDRGYEFEYSYQQNAQPGSGLSRYLVGRRGGLYSWTNDEVKFFDREGGDDAFTYEKECPYDGRGRGPGLAEVLIRWRELIERGVWNVGQEGVVEEEGWWVKNRKREYLRLTC
jgi:hypothetical protein